MSSLKTFVGRTKDVRERFKLEFAKPSFLVQKPFLAPPLSKYSAQRASHIGTAFDYLLRFRLMKINPNALEGGPWIAEMLIANLESLADDWWPGDKALYLKCKPIVTQARRHLTEFLSSGLMSDPLLQSALQLATIDPFERRCDCDHDSVGIIHQEDMADLRNLISAVDDKLFTALNVCLLNPRFVPPSTFVIGADADLVIDDMIIDIKTVQKLTLQRGDFDQLLGYYILQQFGGFTCIEHQPNISKIAIYFSRHAYLHVIPLSEIINPETFPGFLRWFEQRAKEEYPSDLD